MWKNSNRQVNKSQFVLSPLKLRHQMTCWILTQSENSFVLPSHHVYKRLQEVQFLILKSTNSLLPPVVNAFLWWTPSSFPRQVASSLNRQTPHSMNSHLTQWTVLLINEWSCRSTNALLAQWMLSLLNECSPCSMNGLSPCTLGRLAPWPPSLDKWSWSPPTSTNGLLGLPPTSVNGLLSLSLTPQMVSALLQQMASSLDEWPPLLIQRSCSRFTFRTWVSGFQVVDSS